MKKREWLNEPANKLSFVVICIATCFYIAPYMMHVGAGIMNLTLGSAILMILEGK